MAGLARAAAAALLLFSACAPAGAADDPPIAGIEPQIERSRVTVHGVAADLMGALKGAMAAGGAVEAIAVCNEAAPAIAAARSGEDLRIARTSSRPRNPANAPDPWEREVLQRFAAELAAGAKPDDLEHWAVATEEGQRRFRYMKAIVIPAEGPCLACHGSDLAPKVAAALDRLYPDDRARGYKVGDLRGAFSVRQPLP